MHCNLRTLALIGVLALAPARGQNIHIRYTKGSVKVLRGGPDSTVERSLDAALVTDDRVVTGAQSETEVSVDGVNAIQVGPDTEIRLADSYPGRCQWILSKGSVTWNVVGVSASEAELVTPSVSVLPRQPGSYSVALNDQGEVEIAAKDGDLEVSAPTGSQWLEAGQKMVARGPATDPEFKIIAMSRWKRLLRTLSRLQIGVDMASAIASESGGREEKPRASAARNPAHDGNSLVRTPESGHPPPSAGGGHAAASAGGGHGSSARNSASSSSGGHSSGGHSSGGHSSGGASSSGGHSSGGSSSGGGGHSGGGGSSSSSGSHGK